MPHAAWRDGHGSSGGQEPEGLAGRVHTLLAREPRAADGLAEALGEDAAAVAGALALLEVEGLAIRGEGQRWWAAPLRAPRAARPARGPAPAGSAEPPPGASACA